MIFSLRSKIKNLKSRENQPNIFWAKVSFLGTTKSLFKNCTGEICLFFILLVRFIWSCAIVHTLEIVCLDHTVGNAAVRVSKFAKTSKSYHPTGSGHHPAGSRGRRISQIKNRHIAAVAFSISKPLSPEFQFLGSIMCTNHSSKVRFFWGLTWIIIDSKFKLFPRMKTYDKNKNNKFFYLPCGFPKNFIFYTHHDQLEIKLVTGLVHC